MRPSFIAVLFGLGLGLAACHHDPAPMHPADGEMPPLPPSTGTPIGYLIDNASQLTLRDDQITQLKQLDSSLAATNDEIDTQIRQIEVPEEDDGPPPEKGPAGAHQKPPHHNNAPGGTQLHVTADSTKLHELHAANDRDALKRAFAVLAPDQQVTATKLLEQRGIKAPGDKTAAAPAKSDDGVPLEP